MVLRTPIIFTTKCDNLEQMHLAAGLRPDPLRKLKCSPGRLAAIKGEGKGKEGGLSHNLS